MAQSTMDHGLSTRELVDEAKKLASQGYIQEAIDMTSNIKHVGVQNWRNGLQARLVQQKIAKKQDNARKLQATIAGVITVVIIGIIVVAIILSHNNSPVDAKSNGVIVLVTNTPTPDLKATQEQIVYTTELAQDAATSNAGMNNESRTEIAQGTPCYLTCPPEYVILTPTPNN